MRESIFSIFILVIIAIFLSGSFWYGEKLIHGPLKEGYSEIYFQTNLDHFSASKEEDISSMAAEIHNADNKPYSYTVTYYLNDESVASSTLEIQPGQIETLLPSKSILEKINSLSSDKIEFKVEVVSEKLSQTIYKKLIIER